MKRHTETEVAAVVMDKMTEEGWECYPEVQLPLGGRADIVGIRTIPFTARKIVLIVECKTSWTISLLEQGYRALAHANYVALAAPTRPSFFYERLCKAAGIGMIQFTRSADLRIDDYRVLKPRRIVHRCKDRRIYTGPERTVERLHEDQKNYRPGGTATDGYSTPWRRTMDAAVKYIEENPGATIKDLVASVPYHYSSIGSAKQGFLTWLVRRDDVKACREGRHIRFYPTITT